MSFSSIVRRISDMIVRHPKGTGDFMLDTISYFAKSTRVLGMPVNFTIEPTNMCNLRCPVCETGNGTLGRPKQNMPLNDFIMIIDKVRSHANSLILYFYGEPFLNKDIYDMIKYARKCGIFVSMCTNGEFVNAASLVETGLSEISFQIGGIPRETHQAYRVNADLEKCLSNLRELVKLRKQKGAAKPKITLGFIIMKHNENEVEGFKKLAEDIGVDGASIIKPCVRTPEQAREMLPSGPEYWIYDKKALQEKGVLRPKMTGGDPCPWIYYSLTILVNGDVVPCCMDPRGRYVMGNLLSQELPEIWNNREFQEFRRGILKGREKGRLCRLCPGYRPPALY